VNGRHWKRQHWPFFSFPSAARPSGPGLDLCVALPSCPTAGLSLSGKGCGVRLSEHLCGAPREGEGRGQAGCAERDVCRFSATLRVQGRPAAEPGEAGDVACRAVEVLAPELDGRIELVIDYHHTLGHPGQPTAQGYEFRGRRRLVPGPRWRSTSTASFSVS
jgi:hypothetical protein